MKKNICLLLISVLISGYLFNQEALSQSYKRKSLCARITDACIAEEILISTEDEEITPPELFEECKACCISESNSSRCINRCLNKCRKTFQPERVMHNEFRAVELQETMLGVPLDVPIDFLRTNMVDSFKVRFTSSDEQKIITARKSGISPLLKVSVQNNGPQLVVLLNFQTSGLSALNLKPYQVTTENSAEVHKFQIKGVAEKYFVPGAITLFVFVPRAATRTGKFILTPSLEDLSASSSSSTNTSGGIIGGATECQLFQGAEGTCEAPPGGGTDFSTFILTDGSNAGIILIAQGNFVSPTFNIVSQANGFITDAMPVTPEAGCESQHFHGTLFGVQDQGMCGHGKVQKLSATSTYFRPLSDAILLEKSTIEEMKKPDYAEALKDLDAAIRKVDGFHEEFNKQLLAAEAMVTREEFKVLNVQVPCVIKKDESAKELLTKLKDNKAALFDETKASKFIIDALKCKLKILEFFLKIEKKRK